MSDLRPEELAKAEAEKAAAAFKAWILDRARRYLSRWLLAMIGSGLTGGVLAVISLPLAAVVLSAICVCGCVVYAIFAHRLLDDERQRRRWAFVALKRLEQKVIDAQQQVDAATLTVLGRQLPEGVRVRLRDPDLNHAMAVQRQRLFNAEVATGPHQANDASRQPAPAGGPNAAVISARMRQRSTERAALEAEIQSLAVPEDLARAMAAAEAREHARTALDDARKASQEARDRNRRGAVPTQPQPGIGLSVQASPTGQRSVKPFTPPPTPEQIARGEAARTNQE